MSMINRIQLATQKARQLTFSQLVVLSLPVLFGIVLGVITAWANWFYALALALIVPLSILLSSRPVIGVIIWLLIMPFLSVLPSPDMIYWVVHRILIPLTLLLTLVPYMNKTKGRPLFKFRAPEWIMLILLVFVPFNLLWFSSDVRLALIHYADRFLIPFILFFIIRLLDIDKQELRLLEWMAFLLSGTQVVIGLASWLAPGLLPAIWTPIYGARLSGSLANPNVYAIVLVFCDLILFQSAMERRPGPVKFAFLGMCGLGLLCAFLTMERAVWLSTVIALLGLVVLYPRTLFRYMGIAAVLVAIVGGGLLADKIEQAVDRLTQQRQIDDRIVITDALVRMTLEKPVLGWGYDSIDLYIQKYYRQVGSSSPPRFMITSHNTFLTILTEFGVIGFLLYMFPIAYWMILAWKVRNRLPQSGPKGKMVIAMFFLSMLMQLAINNFLDMRFFPYAIAMMWMCVAFIANGVSDIGDQAVVYDQHLEAEV